jgi:hypothetical protein
MGWKMPSMRMLRVIGGAWRDSAGARRNQI